jgi:hypothetical protein
MKLVEINQLKESDLFKKIIAELNIKGLDKIYVKKTKTVDYLDIIIAITNFLESNKNVFKKLNKDNYENLVLIVLVEILEEVDIETNEEQLEKIMTLLKNSLLVQRASNFIIAQFKVFYNYMKSNGCNCCNSKKNTETINSISLEIKEIEKGK